MYRVILNFNMKRRIIKKMIDNTFERKDIKKIEPNKNNINKYINIIIKMNQQILNNGER